MGTKQQETREFDKLVIDFLLNKYHLKSRLVNMENREVRESEIKELLKQAEIELDAIVCFMDETGVLKYASPAHDKAYGKKELDESNANNTHPEDVPWMLEAMEEHCHKNKQVIVIVFRYKGADNEYLKVKSKIFPVFDDSDVLKAFFTVSNIASEEDEVGVSVC